MQVLKPTTKEQLIHYLVNHISLGTYDKKFLSNVYEINKPLTTNQNITNNLQRRNWWQRS
jgi:hypothetical protein